MHKLDDNSTKRERADVKCRRLKLECKSSVTSKEEEDKEEEQKEEVNDTFDT